MPATHYWMTFTAGADATREVLAVRVVHELSDDHTTGRTEVPAFGIVIENDARALIVALDCAAREVAKRYARLDLRFGAMTLAPAGEARALLWANGEDGVIAAERYEAMRTNPYARPQDLARLADLFGDAIGRTDEVAFGGSGAGLEEAREGLNGHAEVAGGQMNLDLVFATEGADRRNLRPVGAAVRAPVEDVALCEAVGRRGIDDDLAHHDAYPAGRLGLGHSAGDGALPRQVGFFPIDDVARANAQRGAQFRPDGERPSGEVGIRVDNPGFTHPPHFFHAYRSGRPLNVVVHSITP